MLLKEDFVKVIQEEALKHEKTAALFKAGDPVYFQVQNSMATMLAMYSQQLEVCSLEPFLKSRSATVYADAAVKGLLFTAKPPVFKLKAENESDTEITLSSGRKLIDANGRLYKLDEPVTIPAKSNTDLLVTQISTKEKMYVVDQSRPFLALEVDQPDDGSFIVGIRVWVNDVSFQPSYKYNGVGSGEKVFHVESDEYRRIFVKFGYSGVIGVQPAVGDKVKIQTILSFGDISPAIDGVFTLEYIQNEGEQNLKITMKSKVKLGTNPVDLSTLREMCKYPSVYDENAVFRGEFVRLVRKRFNHYPFVNVWNEYIEEQARGANVNNVNTLFYSFKIPSDSEDQVEQVKSEIQEIIRRADNSYKFRYVEPVVKKIQIGIKALISNIYDADQIKTQIKELLLSKFDEKNINQGAATSIKTTMISDLLRFNIQALKDSQSDVDVSLTLPETINPEEFLVADDESINIVINTVGYGSDVWGVR